VQEATPLTADRTALTAAVTATAPHSQLIGLTTTTYSGEVEGSDLGLSLN
jgi:hypothetical protein